MPIQPGDPVIIFGGPNKIHLTQIPSENEMIENKQSEANVGNERLIHNRNGIFDLVDCIGKEYGQKLFWDSGKKTHWVVPLRPTPELITKSITHRTQILYRADISLVVLLLDLIPGKRVLECGTGSGSLSYALASAVAPNGHVFTFDCHSVRQGHSNDLFNKTKITNVLTACEGDAYVPNAFLLSDSDTTSECKLEASQLSITEHSIDAAFLDLPSPWKALDNVVQVIKHFGKLVVFTPSIEQIQKVTETLREKGFTRIRTFEILSKPWGISFDGDFDSSDEESAFEYSEKEDASDEYVNYQLPQFNHTGYLTVATFNLF
ncbi:guanidinoacetate N-methyltransferase [Theileria orientalis]|uniref:tRNA (adenine(58)-N(1))-methyltransferase n=1 Tax=Theileria orientalis TaxID=68886 RepID=A0A976QV97_THEOR|nr:guanidinoacetate N-methyltransferase [Theileria orientalis]